MKTSLGILSILSLLSWVNGRKPNDARPCNNQDDCPTVLCCGWAMPFEDEA